MLSLFAKKEKEYAASLENEMDRLREDIKSLSAAKHPDAPVMRHLTESTTLLEEPQPTLYKHKHHTKGHKQKRKRKQKRKLKQKGRKG